MVVRGVRLTDIPEEEKPPLVKPERAEVEVSFTTPWCSLTELPTKGIPYPKGVLIEYRPYTWGEVKKLQEPLLSEVHLIEMLAAGIRFSPQGSMTVLDLAVADFYYISLIRRMASQGIESGWQRTSTCPCGKKRITTKFKAKDVSVRELGVATLPIVTTICGNQLEVSPLRIGRLKEVQEFVLKENADVMIATLAGMIDNMKPLARAYDFLFNLPPDAGEHLVTIFEMLDVSVDPMNGVCSILVDKGNEFPEACGQRFKFSPHLEVGALRPFRES